MFEPDPEQAVAYGIFSARQARAAGFADAEIRQLVRRGTWDRYARGLFCVEGRATQRGDALVRAILAAGPGAVVGFESAATVLGWDIANWSAPARLIQPLNRGSAGFRTRLRDDEVSVQGVLPITTPPRTALDIAADADFECAVIAIDSAFRSRQTNPSELARLFSSSQRKGVIGAREALSFADPASGSVPETEARLLFARAGLPAPTTQLSIRCDDGSLVRPDFAWEEALLAAEIDGFQYHSRGGDFQRDRSRQNKLQLMGWLVLRFTVDQIRLDPEGVAAQLWRGLTRNGSVRVTGRQSSMIRLRNT